MAWPCCCRGIQGAPVSAKGSARVTRSRVGALRAEASRAATRVGALEPAPRTGSPQGHGAVTK